MFFFSTVDRIISNFSMLEEIKLKLNEIVFDLQFQIISIYYYYKYLLILLLLLLISLLLLLLLL